ncbi:protein Aster-B-like isoform X2 [Clytia hemisphaerica]
MINQNISIQPCSPQIGSSEEPNYPTNAAMTNTEPPPSSSLESSTKDYLAPTTPGQPQRPYIVSRQKKSSTTSYNTSLDTDEDLGGALETSNEYEYRYQQASLSDSQTQRNLQDRLQMLSPNRFKKLKKKNRLTQIISGGNYKTKSELFQKLFKNLNPDEKLIIDYSCAFYRDILVHGRLYASQNWLCFYANIFGWETLITVQWTDVTAITKEKTAKVIPNAIQVLTDQEKFFFTTFVNRENAYTALFRIWQNALLGHPMSPDELKQVCKKYRQKKTGEGGGGAIDGDPINYELDETGDEVNEDDLVSTNGSTEQLNKLDPDEGASDINNHSSGANSYNVSTHASDVAADLPSEDAERHPVIPTEQTNGETGAEETLIGTIPSPTEPSFEATEDGRHSPKKTSSVSNFLNGNMGQDEAREKIKNAFKHGIPNLGTRSLSKASDLFRKKKKGKNRSHRHQHSVHLTVPNDGGETTTDFEEGDSDASTDNRLDEDILCPCHDSHTGTEYTNEEFDMDVDTLYTHLFAQDSELMKRVFEERKHENWRYTALEDAGDHQTQTLTYTLNLNYSIGPKTSETVSKMVFPKDNKPGSYYVITTENRSYGVPYSDSFHASVRYCITRAVGNRSRLKVHGDIVYTKRVFGLVKNMISRNGDEAMRSYYVYLAEVLKTESESTPIATNPIGIDRQKRKSKKKVLTKKVSKEPGKNIESQRKSSLHTPKPPIPASQQENNNIFTQSALSSTALITLSVIIFLLLGTNLYILRRLGSLEGNMVVRSRGWTPKELPTSKEEWKTLLEYQKNLHDIELIKLKEVIGNTALLIKQVEGSISALYSEVDKSVASSYDKLSEGLENLQQQQQGSNEPGEGKVEL